MNGTVEVQALVRASSRRLRAGRLWRLLACATAAALAGLTATGPPATALPARVAGATGLPAPAIPASGVLFGLGGQTDVASYESLTASHPNVFQTWVLWGPHNPYFIARANEVGAELMIALSTTAATEGPEVITPGQIAAGQGDGYLLWLSQTLAATGKPSIVRLMAEMNGNNSFSAYDPVTGAARRPGHSTTDFKQAWRRVTLVLRGGSVAGIDAHLRALGMPALNGIEAGRALPRGDVAMFFCPQVQGSPNTPQNSPQAFWPGSAYVDIVGTDFYSAFPNWAGLDAMYASPLFASKPWGFGEWAIWKGDDPAFVHELFAWIRSHARVHLVVYNQGQTVNGELALSLDPLSAQALREELHSPPFG